MALNGLEYENRDLTRHIPMVRLEQVSTDADGRQAPRNDEQKYWLTIYS